MAKATVSIDVTSWIRGPHTGVGLSAWRSFCALSALPQTSFAIEAVSRDPQKNPQVRTLGRWELVAGRKDQIYHGFELKLSPLWQSRRVLTVHDTWTLRPNAYQSAAFQKVQAPRLRRALSRAQAIVVPTHFVADQLLHFDSQLTRHTHVVPWAPFLTASPAVPDATSRVARYVERKRPFVLCVACIETRKNQQVLVNAVRSLSDLDLVVVGGEGHGAKAILDEARALQTADRWQHFSAVTDPELQLLYQHASVFALVSLEEGFGIPVVEAMSFGTPLVLSHIPTFQEVAGAAAALVPATDPIAVANALRERIESKQARAHSLEAAKRYSWKQTAARLMEVYESIADPQ